MSVIRVAKIRGYTVMSNYHLRDKELSCKACGLLSRMLSLPEEWDYTTQGLASICKEGKVKVKEDEYRFDEERNTMIRVADGEAVGCGHFVTKSKKDRKTGATIVETFIEPTYINDYEIIPHHFDVHENEREINAFMQKYVFKPYTLGRNVIGVELNFNKEFYVPEKLESVEDIMKELEGINNDIKGIEL